MKIEENIPLAPHTTFRVGGPANFFVRTASASDIAEALVWARERDVPAFVLGGGTNALVPDEGFEGLVIKIENSDLEVRLNGTILAGAGIPLGRVVQEAVRASLTGLEWATGLPGTVGGAIFGNAGAFGHETGELAREVTAITPMGELRTYKSYHPMPLRGEGRRSNPMRSIVPSRSEGARTSMGSPRAFGPRDLRGRFAEFTPSRVEGLAMTEKEFDEFRYRYHYRWSSFKDWPGFIIVSGVFSLQPGTKSEIEAAMKTAMVSRREHQPLPEQSAGCIFKNPSPEQPAGWLIDQCGLKGTRVGGAEVSHKHANFIVNTGTATARDIEELISFIKTQVQAKTGIELEEEIRLLGVE